MRVLTREASEYAGALQLELGAFPHMGIVNLNVYWLFTPKEKHFCEPSPLRRTVEKSTPATKQPSNVDCSSAKYATARFLLGAVSVRAVE